MDYIPVMIRRFLESVPAMVGGFLATYLYMRWKKKKGKDSK